MSTTTLSRTVKRTGWICGFCGNNNHDRCIAGIHNQGNVLQCNCKVHATVPRCLECGNTNPDELTGWACSNPTDCRDAIAARSAANPLREVLELVKADGRRARETERLAGEARRRALMERATAQIQAAVIACGIDDQIGHDVAADLNPDRNKKPRKPRAPRSIEGICVCGCAGKTRGGRFLPGHDAKLKSTLKKQIKNGDDGARMRMIALGWEKYLPAA